ncbi:MAG: MMPL family transporter, partial [Acetanaerobacterium sp.]
MGSIFQTILKHKITVIAIFFVAAVLCALLASTVVVDYNMMDYLPDDARSTIGLNVMKQEYQQEIPNVRVMIPDISVPEALAYKDRLMKVDGVEEASWLDDAVSLDVPLETLEKSTVEDWYKDSNALYSLTIDPDKEVETLDKIRGIIGEDGAMTGACVNTTIATVTTNAELGKIILVIVPIVFIILLLTTSSWFEPVLFLLTIGVAILLNSGTNAIFGEISFVTKAAGSLLQLAVSMDYSIFLLHRFSEYRSQGKDVHNAMIAALKKSFSSITSSGVTTAIGFAALILMRFKIGPDMGWVMAKGIFFSLLCVLVLLPVL